MPPPENPTSKLTNPTEIARETLRQLTLRKLTPTPGNYQRLYHEISGVDVTRTAQSGLETPFLEVLQSFEKKYPSKQTHLALLSRALTEQNWQEAEIALNELMLSNNSLDFTGESHWAEIIQSLLHAFERSSTGIEAQRKREALQRLLANYGRSAELPNKLNAWLQVWRAPSAASHSALLLEEVVAKNKKAESLDNPVLPVSHEALDAAAFTTPALTANTTANTKPLKIPDIERIFDAAPAASALDFAREALAKILELGVISRLHTFPELQAEAEELLRQVEEANRKDTWQEILSHIRRFALKLELRAGSEQELVDTLHNVLHLLLDNLSELVDEDRWLSAQVDTVRSVLTTPTSLQKLHTVERSLKEVMLRQGTLKFGLQEAKNRFKDLVQTFIDRLGEMTQATGRYEEKFAGYQKRIAQSEDIASLTDLVDALVTDTRGLQLDVVRSREEMQTSRNQVLEAEAKVRALEQELAQVTELVREDQLTGALNRRGLDEEFAREISRAERRQAPLSIALLDLDHFKRLNDTLGHHAGDEALIHLARVVKATLRPTDVLSRYGGEEFIVLLPDSPVLEGVKVMHRLQRELTRQFFMHQNQKILITFSAGVTLFQSGEALEKTIERADQAMYRAKQAGRNRVEMA